MIQRVGDFLNANALAGLPPRCLKRPVIPHSLHIMRRPQRTVLEIPMGDCEQVADFCFEDPVPRAQMRNPKMSSSIKASCAYRTTVDSLLKSQSERLVSKLLT